MSNNPLSSFYRSVKLYITLPSNFKYYDDSIILNDSDNEVGIRAMTGKDEVLMKNPDALLNGKAIEDVIKSCVPQVVNPKKLLQVDLDAILVAIRLASFGETIDVEAQCPKCSYENTFEVNLSNSLDNIKILEESKGIRTKGGLSIAIKPYTFEDSLLMHRLEFDEFKMMKNLKDQSLSDEDKLAFFGRALESASETASVLFARAIDSITLPDNTVVKDREHIAEFLENSDRKLLKSIEQAIKRLSDCGVSKVYKAKCTCEIDPKDKSKVCGHEWDVNIDFNPVNFFTES